MKTHKLIVTIDLPHFDGFKPTGEYRLGELGEAVLLEASHLLMVTPLEFKGDPKPYGWIYQKTQKLLPKISVECMTSTQKRIAIAKACGWKDIEPTEQEQVIWGREPKTGYKNFIPSYTISLDSMAKAEKILNLTEQKTYTLFLHQSSEKSKSDHLGVDFDVLSSTAEQRADAFIKTLDLQPEKILYELSYT
jgi:hypothetical protein